MRFSIVVPVFRTERFLPRCLDSLVAQTDGDFEAIVVDDYSPGDAERSGIATCPSGANPAGSSSPPYQAEGIVARYDERFRYVRHEKNRSAFQARRTGVAAAKGDYIVPVDPDDYLLPETLEKLRTAIEREDPDLVSYRMAYDDGKKVWPHWCHHPDATVSGVEALRELTEHKYFTGVASKAFRRETLLAALCELNAPDEVYVNTCDDFMMLVPMLMKCEKVAFLDFVGYRYFVNGNSTSFSWKTRAGYQRALQQLRVVNGLIGKMACSEKTTPEVRALVGSATKGVEDWFVRTRRESSWMYLLVRRLLRICASSFR